MTAAASSLLTRRWMKLKHVREQHRLWYSRARFRIVPAGRRSGKTELAKRWIILAAMLCRYDDGWFVCAAPTHQQAKRIYWRDLKAMIPKRFQAAVSESELTITLPTGVQITVLGMDQPARIEGRPLDGIILDEYGNMKEETWEANVLPALGTYGREPGWAWFIGVPEGRNHYWRLWKKARADRDLWDGFTWHSSEVLPAEIIEQARSSMDRLTFEQEYEGSFITFEGRTYYDFSEDLNCATRIYQPDRPLIFCFDFNIKPGVAAVLQEQPVMVWAGGGGPKPMVDPRGREITETCAIGEVWIPNNSTTPKVCNRLVRDWGPEGKDHRGDILVYGDATGGTGGSAQTEGSDWDLVHRILRRQFGSKVRSRVPAGNVEERVRVNAMNSRICAIDGTVRFIVDPKACENIVYDFEGVRCVKGGSGEIDKKADPDLTHISDAIGYYVVDRWPLAERTTVSKSVYA